MRYLKYLLFSVIILGIFTPSLSRAQGLEPDQTEIVRAKILDIKSEGSTTLPVLNIPNTDEDITAEILEGTQKNQTVSFTDNYPGLKNGENVYINHTIYAGTGQEVYSITDVNRLPVIYFFVGLFIFLAILIGGFQGIRGLLSLAGSFVLILFVLLPAILHGYSPILTSIGISSLIVILGSYITHGFNKTTSSAVAGMIITIIFTGIMAYAGVHVANFSGYASEEATYLNLNSHGTINLVGILIGGIMIGLLGILYDVAIGQAISVEELHHLAPHIPRGTIFKRAMRMGREHIGALINTLAIAYAGASLPLLLFFSTPPVDVALIVNREIFATEIIRILIGSIGLILAVPITTLLSVYILMPKAKKNLTEEELRKEEKELEFFHHKH
jgi:uncharacterized membrane protein